ncbi:MULTISPECIES: c-type cytochrome [unclassified Rhizobium]|uniref:c-type cytochrome n=1 Tax=unclassified Rhizobium TaxID=2613769 RepID=UPI0007E9757E|nr:MULTISPECIES: cytochrome c [unclassified Rhizobium]ANM13211.1 cytochrome-c domain-containing protein [Rhizobium sp. N324]ANM19609.1 cytochrome-c domain-containing protein [Rhizobium sp. N541]ANM25994.1 cytochrome-c domain-containing protein [Rhizobium sp. N941]OYD01004.1 cytochrome-c domain-containing protein [Rhizobium sp. N4311]
MLKGARLFLIAIAAILIVVSTTWLLTKPHQPFSADDPRLTPGNAERGRLVFAAGGCASCHASPGQPDRLKLGGDLALASPYGTFRIPNISPDPLAGIGSWSVADLANALVAGVSPSGQHYYPVFPYPSYTAMRLDDIRDLYAFLHTLEPIADRPQPHDLALAFRIRRFVGFWKFLFFHERRSEGLLNGDPVHDRGAYLVEVLGHCAECHSSRNIFGAIKPKTRFAGGVSSEGVGFNPNITPEGIGSWSDNDIVDMLESGKTPDHGYVGWSMADVVRNTSELSDADRVAITRYLKSLPPRPTPHP